MVLTWKHNPSLWEEIYRSNATAVLTDLGMSFDNPMFICDDAPAELREMQSMIEQFWQEFIITHPQARNEPKYGLRGIEDIKQGKELHLHVFPIDYATIRFKNSRSPQYNDRLTSTQRELLHKLVTPGVGGYVHNHDRYLVGLRADTGARAGLLEYVPQGLVDFSENVENIFLRSLQRELKEETNLNFDDLQSVRVTHLNIGPKYGDFTLIYDLPVRTESLPKIMPNFTEHSELHFINRRMVQVYLTKQHYCHHDLSPVTMALFENIL